VRPISDDEVGEYSRLGVDSSLGMVITQCSDKTSDTVLISIAPTMLEHNSCTVRTQTVVVHYCTLIRLWTWLGNIQDSRPWWVTRYLIWFP